MRLTKHSAVALRVAPKVALQKFSGGGSAGSNPAGGTAWFPMCHNGFSEVALPAMVGLPAALPTLFRCYCLETHVVIWTAAKRQVRWLVLADVSQLDEDASRRSSARDCEQDQDT
jgi:hypothetical protein